jgi:hypothetical protein
LEASELLGLERDQGQHRPVELTGHDGCEGQERVDPLGDDGGGGGAAPDGFQQDRGGA